MGCTQPGQGTDNVPGMVVPLRLSELSSELGPVRQYGLPDTCRLIFIKTINLLLNKVRKLFNLV